MTDIDELLECIASAWDEFDQRVIGMTVRH